MLEIVNNLSDLNLNNDLKILDLLEDADSLGCVLYSYLWRSDSSPKNLQLMLNDVRTFIKLNYRNQWLEELRMTRKQKSTELSRSMLTQEVPEAWSSSSPHISERQYTYQCSWRGISLKVTDVTAKMLCVMIVPYHRRIHVHVAKYCIGRIRKVTHVHGWRSAYIGVCVSTYCTLGWKYNLYGGNSLVICDAYISNGYKIQTYNV